MTLSNAEAEWEVTRHLSDQAYLKWRLNANFHWPERKYLAEPFKAWSLRTQRKFLR